MKSEMLETALSFLDFSVEKISKKKPSASELKSSIVLLFSAVEITLKARLFEEHWTLVFANLNEASRDNLEKGDLISVSVDKAIDRLRNVCEIDLTPANERYVRSLQKQRNKIIHIGSGAVANHDHARAILLRAHSFLIDFVADADLFDASSGLENDYREVVERIAAQKKFVEERMKGVAAKLGNRTALKCPVCWEIAIPLEQEKLECLLCRIEPSSEVFLEFVVRDDGCGTQLCPECGDESAAYVDEIAESFCFSCKTTLTNYAVCEDCGEYMDSEEYDRICGDCMQMRFDSDQMMPAPSKPEPDDPL